MTQPTNSQIDADQEQVPTTAAGAVYLLMKLFGPWSLMGVFLVVVWYTGERKGEKWEALLRTSIENMAAQTSAMKAMTDSIQSGHTKVEEMREKVTSISNGIVRIEAVVNARNPDRQTQ